MGEHRTSHITGIFSSASENVSKCNDLVSQASAVAVEVYSKQYKMQGTVGQNVRFTDLLAPGHPVGCGIPVSP